MTLIKASSAIMLYHLKHVINEHQKLINYLNSLFTNEEHQATIQLFRNQIMQVHEKVEVLMFNFIEFLKNNSLYLQMTLEKEE
jgi:hypothetical protein